MPKGNWLSKNYHPAWYLNLQATQEGVIEVTGKQQTAYAEDTTGAERERLWAMIVSKARCIENTRRRQNE